MRCAMQAEDFSLGDVLPCPPLESIKELKLRHPLFHDRRPSWQQWPMAWSQLTALTSLSCQLCPDFHEPLIPAVLIQMTSLRKLNVSLDNDPNDCSDGEDSYDAYVDISSEMVFHLVENTRGLTRLTSLWIGNGECLDLRDDILS